MPLSRHREMIDSESPRTGGRPDAAQYRPGRPRRPAWSGTPLHVTPIRTWSS